MATLTHDVHFVSPAPVPSPGSAGLQPGSRSHAGAWRSQGKPWSTGSGCMKQTSQPRASPQLATTHPAYQLRYLAHPTDIAIAISQDKPDQNILRGLRVAKQMGLLTIVLSGGNSPAIDMTAHTAVDHLLVAPAEEGNLRSPSIGASRARQGTTHPDPLPASAPA